ncbi:MAG: ASKHA domain-containing protein [Opitutaceae bacterium]
MHQITIEETTGLATWLRGQNIPLKMSCGGHGSCKTCRVILDGNPVLACQTEVAAGSYDLTVPESAASSGSIQIDLGTIDEVLPCRHPRWTTFGLEVPRAEDHPQRSNRQRLESVLPAGLRLDPFFFRGLGSGEMEGHLEVGCFDGRICYPLKEGGRRPFAIAVDLGTTTLAAALIDLTERRIVASLGRLNGQYAYAEDLVARIAFCRSRELIGEMQDLVLGKTMIPLIRELLKGSGVSGEEVLTTVVSGNAPMIHLLLGEDPTGMGGWPFNGVDFAPPPRPATAYRLPGGQLEFTPSQSAYLGGDIISGLLLTDFESAEEGTLFIDLGTNAEMALKANGRLYCTAVPAGPSFEGGGFPCGISAIPGAIDEVSDRDGELTFTTIGGQPAVGICGSGIISYVASAYRAGLLRKKGRYAKRDPRVEVVELLGEQEKVVRLTDEIYVSETDISNFLQAKAAVFAGLFTLCRMAGLDVFELRKICIAGNFGRRIRIHDIMDIGIIPPLPVDRVEVVGNTSLKGAVHTAIDATAQDRMAALVSRLSFVELNAQPTFQDDFINALFIPHLKMEWGGGR